ncbi:guanylate kinase [bacterium]|nr:guanylate kinase [bacterium]
MEKNKKKKGSILFIISGPSGVGKSTLCDYLLSELPALKFSVSTTTRPIRGEEVDGVNYIFKDKEEFKNLVDQNEFLEWAIVHNNYYGTQKQMVNDFIDEGFDVVLEVDVQGGLAIQENDPRAVLIFVAPPKFSDLEQRLVGRGTDTDSVIKTRLNNAHGEMQSIKLYDYLIVNDSLEESKDLIRSIFTAERNKASRTLSDYIIR